MDKENITKFSELLEKIETENQIPTCEDKLDELIIGKWGDSYLRLLAIADHINECKMKYDAYKMASNDTDMTVYQLKHEYNKELMDLSILLEIEKSESVNMQILYENRLDKFLSKLD